MIIRKFDENDIERILRIEKDCFSDPWTAEMWKSEIARSDFFGIALEENGEIFAFACTTVLFEDAELLKIAVEKKRRGSGYGGKLLDELLTEAKNRGAERMFLEVRASNIPALRLYESRGFVKTRLRKKYYADGEDAVEMVAAFPTLLSF